MGTLPPVYADFLVTPKCNFNCTFCSASAMENNHDKIKVLSLETIEKTLYDMDDLGLLRISFEGGEPFLRDDFIEILEIADRCDFEYYVNTNGSLIDKAMAKRLGKTKIPQVCMSIDGPSAEVHDMCRGYKGSFEKMKNAVKYLHEQGIRVQAIITLTKLNASYLYETMKFIKSLGITSASMMLLATVGGASEQLCLDFNEWTDLLLKLSIDKQEGKLPIELRIVPTGESRCPWELYLPLKNSGRTDLMSHWIPENSVLSFEDTAFGCTSGKTSMAIDGYGNVYGCSLMVSMDGLSAGNINDDPIKEIWNRSQVFNDFRKLTYDQVQGPCSDCDDLSKCMAGCRACAYSLTGLTNGSDLRCPSAKG